jgi:hypothetical protein
LMNFYMSTVGTPQGAARIRSEQREHLRPQATSAPSAKTCVDRIPRPKLLGQVSPLHPCSQDIVNPADHNTIIFGWSSARAIFSDTSGASIIRSIFLSAPRADQVKLDDLMES